MLIKHFEDNVTQKEVDNKSKIKRQDIILRINLTWELFYSLKDIIPSTLECKFTKGKFMLINLGKLSLTQSF